MVPLDLLIFCGHNEGGDPMRPEYKVYLDGLQRNEDGSAFSEAGRNDLQLQHLDDSGSLRWPLMESNSTSAMVYVETW